MAALSVRNLCKLFGGGRPDGSAAVDAFTHEFASNAVTTILGPSGGGKTTLLHLVAGLLRPDAGSVLIDGRDVTPLPPERRGVAVVFQSYALFPHLGVRGNVEFGLRSAGISVRERGKRVQEILDRVRIPHLLDRKIGGLSGGEQQRVALARALVMRPRVLLLDEPLSALDAPLRERLGDELIALLRECDTTTLYVTHDRGEALGLGESLVVMNAGRLEQSGLPAEVYERPASRFVAEFACGANVVEGECVETPGGRVFRLPFATVPAPPQTPLGRCGVVLRPDAFGLVTPETAGPAVFCGEIESARPLGDRVRLSIRVPGTPTPLKVHAPRDPGIGRRKTLCLRVKSASAVPR